MLPSTTILPSGDNCKRQCGYMDKTVKKLLAGGQKPASSLRMDLDEELVVERNYRKTRFALRIHTHNALKRFNMLNALLTHYECNIIP